MAKRPDLVVLTGELKGRRFSVSDIALRLGRSSSNDIHIPDEELSRNHCLFEISGESGIRVTDLASANGTVVNGISIGSNPKELKEGDIIIVGSTRLSVGDVQLTEDAKNVDLGLDTKVQGEGTKSTVKRAPIANLLWGVTALILVGVTALLLLSPTDTEETTIVHSPDQPVVREVTFEKVLANSEGIFRYALKADASGRLTVEIDDTKNNRHMLPKSKILENAAKAELNDILAFKTLSAFEDEYIGIEPDPPALNSFVLKVVYSTRVKKIAVINTQEPDEFLAVREKLESFSKSELGVWAIAYSRDRLIELARDSLALGDRKWEDRDVNYGNLSASISAYQEVVFYLDTVNPKPSFLQEAIAGLDRAKKELDRRYTNQRFLADKALNMAQWEVACDELKVLLEMIPDRKDDRHRDARQKLVSAEGNLKKNGGK